MKYGFFALVFLFSTNTLAVLNVKEFNNVAQYKQFLKANPTVKIINVAPVLNTSKTASTGKSTAANSKFSEYTLGENSNTQYYNSLIVTFDGPENLN